MSIDKTIVNANPLGRDSIRGGIFFNSSMLPAGTFSNVPKFYNTEEIKQAEPTLMLTLQKVKDSINTNIKDETGAALEDSADVNLFLSDFINLLIDYRDLRNYVFYGSANTELAYNIKWLIDNYPYNTLIGERYGSGDLNINYRTYNNKEYTEIIFPEFSGGASSGNRLILDNYNKFNYYDNNENFKATDYELVDKNGRRYPINKIITPFGNTTNRLTVTKFENINVVMGGHSFDSIKVTTLEPHGYSYNNIEFKSVYLNGEIVDPLFSVGSKQYPLVGQQWEVLSYDTSTSFVIKRAGGNAYETIELQYDPLVTNNWSGIAGKYISDTIFSVGDLEEYSFTENYNGNPFTYDTLRIKTKGINTYKKNDIIEFRDFYESQIPLNLKIRVPVFNGTIYVDYFYNVENEKFIVKEVQNVVVNPNNRSLDEFYVVIARQSSNTLFENIYLDQTINPNLFEGIVRINPMGFNERPLLIKVVIDGRLSNEALLNFELDGLEYTGFMLSKKQSIINEWNIKLTPVQNMLLSPTPINPTPWPRRDITNNIQNIATNDEGEIENEFYYWLTDPKSMYVNDGLENDNDLDEAYGDSLMYEFNLARALVLDESQTNQLIRRTIPYDIISEINDEERYFQRFILITGWLFDQIRLYVKFIKYSHTINYGEFDQLSPEFYRYYSEHYGLNLFEDESIDFTKLIIKTEPGYYYVNDKNYMENKYYRNTLQKLQYERQKRLLVSLFHLYRTKGTQECIKKLVSLIGAPDGLLVLNEYAFAVNNLSPAGYPTNGYAGTRVINNEKVHNPSVSFEIDPDFLIDKLNINNPINKPYTYRKILSNEYIHNLREISVNTDPNQAIDNQIMESFGNQKYNYIKFDQGGFANLQTSVSFYLLPLSIPDKYYGMSFEYMIPKNGYKKGIGTNQEESTVNLFSLYEIDTVEQDDILTIEDLLITDNVSSIIVTTTLTNNYILGDKIFIFQSSGITNLNNRVFQIQEIISATQFKISGNFLIDSTQTLNFGKVISGRINKLIPSSFSDPVKWTYPLAVEYNERNKKEDEITATGEYGNPLTDFAKLKNFYVNSIYVDDKSYIITRLEGNDLVVRLRIRSEVDDSYVERCAIFENIFSADGLNHSIRMILREEGIEVYKDYKFVGLPKWINVFINEPIPYRAYEVPKSEILRKKIETENCEFNYYDPIKAEDVVAISTIGNMGDDVLNWWDLFIGMPNNIDIFFKKINFYENNTINDYNIGDKIKSEQDYTAEFYVFEAFNPSINSMVVETKKDFVLNSVFYEKFPNSVPDYYGYSLPTKLDAYNRNIINNLTLTNKRCYYENVNYATKDTLYVNKTQDFFDFNNLFENNAWNKDIHKIYFYDLFAGKINELYYIYSSQVLTYKSLMEFLDLIEGKFRNIITQFIPIVVDMSNFGRQIKNSNFNLPKMRIPGNDKVCVGAYTQVDSFVYTNVYKNNSGDEGIIQEGGLNFKIIDGSNNELFSTDIVWDTNVFITLSALVLEINNYFEFNNIDAGSDIYSNILRISINRTNYMNQFSIDPNDFKIVITQDSIVTEYNFGYGNDPDNDLHNSVINNCGVTTIEQYRDRDVCGSITYSLPNKKARDIFWHYAEENADLNTLYYDSENSNDKVFVKNSNE